MGVVVGVGDGGDGRGWGGGGVDDDDDVIKQYQQSLSSNEVTSPHSDP